jgi:adenylate kinase family enzyme
VIVDNQRIMRKVLVIGSGGAGKSTFAKELGKILDIEVIHLDSLYWNPGWVETPKAEWKAVVEGVVAQDSWIMDGNYSGTLDLRFAACDTVVFLDIDRLTCLWRVIKRAVKYWGRSRPDMAQGCPERLSLEFILWIWNYKKRTHPKIVSRLEENSQGKEIIWLRSGAEVERFLAGISDI